MVRVFLFVCVAAGCTLRGDGQRLSETRVLDYFDAVEVFDNFVTDIVVDPGLLVGGELEVVVAGDANLLDHVFTGVHGPDTLSAGVDSNNLVAPKLAPELAVELPVLVTLYAEDDTTTTVSGAGGEVELSVHDAATVKISGAGVLTISASGAASVEAQGFRASRVTVDVQGDATVVVCSEAEPTVTGTGTVERRCE